MVLAVAVAVVCGGSISRVAAGARQPKAGFYGGAAAACPANSYCPPGAAAPSPCPLDTESPAGSSAPTDCTPTAGHYGPAGAPAAACPAGSYCAAGAAAPTACPAHTDSAGACVRPGAKAARPATLAVRMDREGERGLGGEVDGRMDAMD